MEIFDTHCHIHEITASSDVMADGTDGVPADAGVGGSGTGAGVQTAVGGGAGVHGRWQKAGKTDPDQVIADAAAANVTRLLCVGCTVADSELAVDFAQGRPQVWASIGIHPHEAQRYVGDADNLVRFAQLATREKVVAVGECGLDYFYNHSPKDAQEKILRFQLELAAQHDLPLVLHIREAFADFWPIFDSYVGSASRGSFGVSASDASSGRQGAGGQYGHRKPLRGVVHSFTATRRELDQALERGLYIGLNGIMTFTKDVQQLEAAKAVPLDRLLIETDAPFLTPAPNRGTICEPKHAATSLAFIAHLQEKTDQQLAAATTANARRLFGL